MRENREIVQRWVGLSEGGYVNHPQDKGGPTDRGITQATYDAWNRVNGRPQISVRGISKDVAEQIIFENYMLPVRFDDLPSGLDYAMADYAVNSGVGRAVKDLQRCIGGLTVDGIFGNQTMAKVREIAGEPFGISDLIEDLCARRMAFVQSLSNWPTFGTGWTWRIMGNQSGTQAGTDIGVVDRAVHMSHGVRELLPDPVDHHTAKAPEPPPPQTALDDPSSLGGLLSGGGAVTALAAVLGQVGQLHPVAQGIAVSAAVLALAGAVWVLHDRARKRRAGLA